MERPNETEENAYDEFIEQLIQQNRELLELQSASNTKPSDYPTVYIPDYNNNLKLIQDQLDKLNQGYKKENISALFEQMDKKINAMPKVIPVKHHHHFDPKSKWIPVVYFILVIAVSILTRDVYRICNRDISAKKGNHSPERGQTNKPHSHWNCQNYPTKESGQKKTPHPQNNAYRKHNCQTKFVTP
jgi:hypothetical protein